MSRTKRKTAPQRQSPPVAPGQRRAAHPLAPLLWARRLAERSWRLPGFLAAYVLLAVFSIVFIYFYPLNGPPIRSDGLGYYIYLPALFLDHDLTMRTMVEERWMKQIRPGSALTPVGDGHHYVDKFGPGVAMLQAPFYLLGHAVDRTVYAGLADHPERWPYQFAMTLGGLVYGGLGLLFLWLALRRFFSETTIAWTITAVTFGTDLFHYATYDSTVNNHIFAFCCYAALLWALAGPCGTAGRAGWRRLVFGGLAAGMTVVVRIPNAIWLAAALPWVAEECFPAGAAGRRAFSPAGLRRLLAFCGAAAVPVGLMMVYWKIATGSFFYRTYGDEAFNFLSPYLFSVLFSVKKGLFFWAPVLLLGVAGAVGFARRAPALAATLWLPLAVHTYIVASWWCWYYGGSFGHRAFVEAMPVFAYPLAHFLEFGPRGRWGVAVRVALVAAVAWSIHLNLKYWFGMYSFDGPTWADFRKMFFQPLPL